jgi:hypothetical protein
MFKALVRLAIPVVLIGAISGCQQEIGSQNPNAPPGGHAEGVHDQGGGAGAAGGAGGAAGSHAQ